MSSSVDQVSHYRVWALAGPIILSNISVPLVGAVDTAVVGHLPGPQAIGAVALGALIFSFLYWGFGFLRMGTTGFVARALGANNQLEVDSTLARVLGLSMAFGLVLILLGTPIISFALVIIESSPEVEELASEYSHIRIFSAPATLVLYAVTGVLIGLQKTKLVFLVQITLNLINVFLDLLFVPVLELGVAGVAWASLIAEYCAAILGLWLLRHRIIRIRNQSTFKELVAIQPLLALMQSNGHIFVRTICLVFSFAFFTAQGAKLGELVLAANTILMHLHSIMAYGLDGFAHAAEALAGSAYGAKNPKRFHRVVRLTTAWAAVLAICIGSFYLILGEQILGLFSNQQEVLQMAVSFLPWMIIAPMISIWSFQLDGIFIGVGHTKEMRNAMLLSTLLYLALVWALLPLMGNHGLFLSLTLFMLLRAVTLGYYYPQISKAMVISPDQNPGN